MRRPRTGAAHRPPGKPGGRVVLSLALLLLGIAQAQHPGNTPRRWRAAAEAQRQHHVSCTLLVAISLHEQPSPRCDWYATGCNGVRSRVPRRGDPHYGLQPQMDAAARLCRRVLGERALSPTFADLKRLNRSYAQDPRWHRRVWSFYQRMRP